jgi:AcrR family transcriptional regulator
VVKAKSPKATPRQEEILDHTLALVREEGLAGVTVRRVADRVGFSEAAVYRHFPSKQDLMLALMDRFGDRLIGVLEKIALETRRSAIDRLADVLRHHVRIVLETRGLPVMVLGEALASGNEVLSDRVRKILRFYLDLLEQLIAELPPAASRPPASELAILLMGLPAGMALRTHLLPERALEDGQTEELVLFMVSRLTGVDLQSKDGNTK